MHSTLAALLGLLLLCASETLGDRVVFVAAIWRHGERNARYTFRNDPYTESDWKNGYGALTKTGYTQQTRLGGRLRTEYLYRRKIFRPNFVAALNEVFFQSSDVDRCLLSAQAVATAFMGKRDDYTDKEHCPVPIHASAVPYESDRLLNPDAPCQLYYDIWHEIERSWVHNQFHLNHTNLFEIIDPKVGVYSASTSWMLYDALSSMQLNGKTWPSWVTEEIFSTLEEVNNLAEDFRNGINLQVASINSFMTFTDLTYYGQRLSTLVPRIRAGKLLWEVIERLKTARTCHTHQDLDEERQDVGRPWQGKNKRCKVKFIGYSAHDTTLHALLAALGAKQAVLGDKVPRYNDAIVFELFERDRSDGTFYVKANYWHFDQDKKVDFTEHITNCTGTECSLEDFEARSLFYKPPDDFDQWCKRGLGQYEQEKTEEDLRFPQENALNLTKLTRGAARNVSTSVALLLVALFLCFASI